MDGEGELGNDDPISDSRSQAQITVLSLCTYGILILIIGGVRT